MTASEEVAKIRDRNDEVGFFFNMSFKLFKHLIYQVRNNFDFFTSLWLQDESVEIKAPTLLAHSAMKTTSDVPSSR